MVYISVGKCYVKTLHQKSQTQDYEYSIIFVLQSLKLQTLPYLS